MCAFNRLAVTGAAGFLGASVVRRAIYRGLAPVAIVRRGEKAELEACEVRVVDWDRRESLVEALDGCDAIVNAAGLTPFSGEHMPGDYYDANVQSVWRLLDAVASRPDGVRVLLISSAAVYGPGSSSPISEEAPKEAVGHYAASKALADTLAGHYHQTDGLDLRIARLFNIVGPGAPAESLVGTIVSQLLQPEVRVRESVSVRDFVDVEDAADGILRIVEMGESGAAYNVCTGEGTSVKDLFELACDAWSDLLDGRPELVVDEPSEAGTVSVGDCSKLLALGWSPCFTLGDSLRRMRIAAGASVDHPLREEPGPCE